MPGFFRRFFLSDFGPPPPPDVAHQPSFPGQRIVETIYSESKRERVFITVDDSDLYRFHVQCWDTTDWKSWGKALWTPTGGSGSHTDSIDAARSLAVESLRCSRYDA